MPATETKENKREQQRPPAKTPAPAPATPAPTVPPKDQGVPPSGKKKRPSLHNQVGKNRPSRPSLRPRPPRTMTI